MTVTEAFGIFKSELELPDRRQQQASTAQQEIRAALTKFLDISDSFLTGSYARHTKIDPLNDIDVFLVRNASRVSLSTTGGIGPVQAIDQVALGVGAAYPTAILKKQSRSVNVKLPAYPFAFDLVPRGSGRRTASGSQTRTSMAGFLPTPTRTPLSSLVRTMPPSSNSSHL